MSAPAPPPFSEIPFASRLRPAVAFAFCVGPLLVGVGIACAFHLKVLWPRYHTGSSDLNRIIALGQHLRDPRPPGPVALFIGDSVTVEGIDASIVERHAPPGWRVENLAINGSSRPAYRVVLPLLLRTRPAVVLLLVRPQTIGRPAPMPEDAAYAYALGGFAEAWPEGWVHRHLPGMTPRARDGLTSGGLPARIHFRTAVTYLLNDGLRARVNRRVKYAQPYDWQAPFNLTASDRGPELAKRLRDLELEVLAASTPADIVAGERDLDQLVEAIHEAGVVPVLVTSPVHPGLREAADAPAFSMTARRLREVAATIVGRHGGLCLDASLALDAEQFADGQHPNQTGRDRLSALIGAALPAVDQAAAITSASGTPTGCTPLALPDARIPDPVHR